MISLSKLGAGDGYEYYLRSIATNDIDDRGGQDLSGYYSERGESPGRWVGSGLANVGITAGEQVSEAQMRALYGRGMHPNADAMIAAEIAEKMSEGISRRTARAHAVRLARLGQPFGRHVADEYSFRYEVAHAYADHNTELGRVSYAPIPAEDRARITTEVADRMYAEERGHAPLTDADRSGWIARASRTSPKAVAGYDFTASPVKSVSVLWALAPEDVAAKIEAAHHAAVAESLEYLETRATFTRCGRHSIRQEEVVGGVIATVFDHRESRAGDPDLHSHMVISRAVLRHDGQWGAIDSNMLYRHNVAVSELYNTRLEHHLEAALGLVFVDSEAPRRRGERPVREIAGVPEALIREWSKRSREIEDEEARLASEFQDRNGREPTPKELLDLGQKANLKTRSSKPEARTRAEQRIAWRRDAAQILGGEQVIDAFVADALNQQAPQRELADPAWITRTAARVVEVVSGTRATWHDHHIRAEVHRQLRGPASRLQWSELAEQVTAAALTPPLSIPRGVPEPVPDVEPLTRSDGTSVYTTAGSLLYTSPQIVAAEERLVAASLRTNGHTISSRAVELAIVEYAANNHGKGLNAGQRALAHEFATSGSRLQVLLAPAGTGKTTGMQALTRAWQAEGGNVLGVSPLGSAAAHLGREIGVPGVTVDVLITLADALDAGTLGEALAPKWISSIDHRTLVIIDEIGKTPTLKLDRAVSWLLERGASIRTAGDTRQLSAVAAGGVVRDIVAAAGALTLDRVLRFADPAERAASLALREGDPAAIAFYTDNNRVQVGTIGAVAEAAFQAWQADYVAGLDTALLAPTRELVTRLNRRARADRLDRIGGPDGPEAVLADGLSASVGDIITTRENNYRLRISATDHVRNGYRWKVRTVHRDGAITATHLASGRRVTLPASYVAEHVELGYAATIDSVQGLTVDTCHGVLTGRESAAQLYVMLSRARLANYAYIATAGSGDESAAYTYDALHPQTAVDALTAILARDGTQTSATTAARDAADPHHRLAGAVDAYLDALGVAADTYLGAEHQATVTAAAEQLVPGISDEPAWPVLRRHLARIALDGRDPVAVLTTAVNARELDTADDKAAVLDWRIDPTGAHSARLAGPMRWLPEVPPALTEFGRLGEHLTARSRQISDLAAAVADTARGWTAKTAPLWAQHLADSDNNTDTDLTAELAVWRAAHKVDDRDRRLTGPAQFPVAERREQHRLNALAAERLGGLDADARRWKPLAERLEPRLVTDPYWPDLAAQWTQAADAGLDVPTTARDALAQRPLPDEQPAAALRWRMSPQLDEAQDTAEKFAQAVADLESNAWHRMSEDALTAYIDKWQRRAAADQHARDREPIDHLGQVHAADEKLTADEVAIRAAQAAASTAKEQRTQAREAFDAAETVRQQLAALDWWQSRRRKKLTADLAELERTEADTLEETRTAIAAAKTARDAVGIQEYQWSAKLAEADDTTARNARLTAAQAREDLDAEVRQRIDSRITDANRHIDIATGERNRRRHLDPAERDLEQRAREHLDARNSPAEHEQASVKPTQSSWRETHPHYQPPTYGQDVGGGIGI
ncbi:MobF family relaxase (plasmid) [Nocardia pseudovaccinii]|uniref:MobF family relaxase n=1 Tax=Nocardia pseudovaccinii TaxID=189540 RepID=UPI003D8E5F1F